MHRDSLVILSDRGKGIANAISTIMPMDFHFYCVFHIEKNIKTKFRTDVDGLIWKITKANSILDFNVVMCDLRKKIILFMTC